MGLLWFNLQFKILFVFLSFLIELDNTRSRTEVKQQSSTHFDKAGNSKEKEKEKPNLTDWKQIIFPVLCQTLWITAALSFKL